MEKAKGKVAEIIPKTAKTKRGEQPKFVVRLGGNETAYSGWGKCPWEIGDQVEFEFTKDKKVYDGEEVTFFNIVQKKQGSHSEYGNFDDVVKALTIPKIHVGMEEDVMTDIIECGTYKKVLTRKVTINLSVNPMEINAEEIDRIKKLARLALENEIGKKSEEAKPAGKPEPPERKETESGPPQAKREFVDSHISKGQKSLIEKTFEKKGFKEEVREYE